MKFLRFDIKNHDIKKVSELIFETEPKVFSLLFGNNKNKALKRIKSVVKTGGNSFGYEYIYLAIEKNKILGLTIFYNGLDIDKKIESDNFSKALGFFGIFRLMLYDQILLRRLLTNSLDERDMYISNICVDQNIRGKGIGRFLLDNVILQANKDHCKKIILDVSKDNGIAINLYKNTGFKIINKKTSKFWKITVCKMIKKL